MLRSLNLQPELCSYVNSAAAEQKNRKLSYDRYFLCQIKEKHFLFSLRLIFHLHNEIIRDSKKHGETYSRWLLMDDCRLTLQLNLTYWFSAEQNPYPEKILIVAVLNQGRTKGSHKVKLLIKASSKCMQLSAIPKFRLLGLHLSLLSISL